MSQWHEIDFESVEAVTEKAVLFATDDGELWVPKSQIAPADREQYEKGDGPGSVSVSEWWARRNGFE